jgi:hypothetical protein
VAYTVDVELLAFAREQADTDECTRAYDPHDDRHRVHLVMNLLQLARRSLIGDLLSYHIFNITKIQLQTKRKGKHANPLVPAEFAVVSTHQHALGLCGELSHIRRTVSLCVIHKEALCPSSGDINRLMIMMMDHFDTTWMSRRNI